MDAIVILSGDQATAWQWLRFAEKGYADTLLITNTDPAANQLLSEAEALGFDNSRISSQSGLSTARDGQSRETIRRIMVGHLWS